MRNVVRLEEPLSLQENGEKWKKELLAKIDECKQIELKVPDLFFDKYKQNDVKERLVEMYGSYCCYCEGLIGVVNYGHIEHRKPKRKFPNETFDWENLHLSCDICNTKKGTKYSTRFPILDAVKDKISDHMEYEVNATGCWWTDRSPRGKTTEEHADLNREKLRGHRLEAFNEVMGLILKIRRKIRRNQNAPGLNVAMAQLEEMCKGQYGSVITFAKQELLG